jgi:hypothetical protein
MVRCFPGMLMGHLLKKMLSNYTFGTNSTISSSKLLPLPALPLPCCDSASAIAKTSTARLLRGLNAAAKRDSTSWTYAQTHQQGRLHPLPAACKPLIFTQAVADVYDQQQR